MTRTVTSKWGTSFTVCLLGASSYILRVSATALWFCPFAKLWYHLSLSLSLSVVFFGGDWSLIRFVVHLLSCVQLFATPWTTTHQASLSFTVFQSWLNLMSIESVMPSNHLILSPPPPLTLSLCQHQGLFQRVDCSHQLPKYWSFSFSISLFNEYTGLISFRIDWFDFLLSKQLWGVFCSTTQLPDVSGLDLVSSIQEDRSE